MKTLINITYMGKNPSPLFLLVLSVSEVIHSYILAGQGGRLQIRIAFCSSVIWNDCTDKKNLTTFNANRFCFL